MSQLPGAGSGVSIVPPHGLDQIIDTFGDIFSYIRTDHTLDASWQAEYLTAVHLPFPLSLSWNRSRQVEHITCHRLLQSVFENVFATLSRLELQSKVVTFSGCFCFRPKRNGTKLSAHSWGIAIDLNPESNEQGTKGDMDPEVISAFRDAQFTWGGEWPGAACDPMHFQFCTGY